MTNPSPSLNPLKLDQRNRAYYEALVDLNTTDVNDDSWLEKFRRVKRIKQVEGKAVLQGFKCFYNAFGNKSGFMSLETAVTFWMMGL